MNPAHVEIAVIGGSNAGLSAALALGRARRSVAVVDDTPRNAPAAHARNVYTRDDTPPAELLRVGREQLKPYDVRFVNARVGKASRYKGAFVLELNGGETLNVERILLATGVSDDLPDLPGLRELWGKSVYTCPYCHGWEVRDLPLAVLGDGNEGYGYARLLWEAVPKAFKQGVCFTDFWDAYRAVIPNEHHQAVGKDSGLKAHVERFDNTIRQRTGPEGAALSKTTLSAFRP